MNSTNLITSTISNITLATRIQNTSRMAVNNLAPSPLFHPTREGTGSKGKASSFLLVKKMLNRRFFNYHTESRMSDTPSRFVYVSKTFA